MLHVSMVGCGAIGQGVLELLKSDPDVCFDAVIVPEHAMDKAREAIRAACAAFGQRTHGSSQAADRIRLRQCARRGRALQLQAVEFRPSLLHAER